MPSCVGVPTRLVVLAVSLCVASSLESGSEGEKNTGVEIGQGSEVKQGPKTINADDMSTSAREAQGDDYSYDYPVDGVAGPPPQGGFEGPVDDFYGGDSEDEDEQKRRSSEDGRDNRQLGQLPVHPTNARFQSQGHPANSQAFYLASRNSAQQPGQQAVPQQSYIAPAPAVLTQSAEPAATKAPVVEMAFAPQPTYPQQQTFSVPQVAVQQPVVSQDSLYQLLSGNM